jgi:hypothetical protein
MRVALFVDFELIVVAFLLQILRQGVFVPIGL